MAENEDLTKIPGDPAAVSTGPIVPAEQGTKPSKPKGKGTGAKMGRPTMYSDDLGTSICVQVMAGSNLHKICQAKDMPSRDTLYQWLASNGDFADNYARACKIRREDKFERLEAIADEEEDVARARLKVDVIKWQLSKEEPRKYGDKLDMTTDGDKINRGMTDAELDAILARAGTAADKASPSPKAG